MDYQGTETIILNDEEFLLMLAAAGIEEWYGIEPGGGREAFDSERFMNEKLAGLYRKGMVEWGAEKARISDEASPMFRVLKNAPVCVTALRGQDEEPVSGSYCCEGEVVMTERGTGGEDELRLTLMPAAEWIEFFEKSGYFPKTVDAPPKMGAGKEDPGDDERTASFEVRRMPGGELMETLALYDCGVYGKTVRKVKNRSSRRMFRSDEVRSVMYGWAGGAAK